MISPEYELLEDELVHTGRVVPIYPETKGVSSKWLRSKIHTILELNKKMNQTFIIVTHNELMTSRAGRVIELEDGRIKNNHRN